MLYLRPQWKKQLKYKDFVSLDTLHLGEGRGLESYSWHFAKQFPIAEKILVNDIPFSSHSRKTLSLLPGFYKFTLLSNAFQPIQAFLHTESLNSWQPQWVPLLRGNCFQPLFQYPLFKIKPKQALFFFNISCVKSLAQTARLSNYLKGTAFALAPKQDVDIVSNMGFKDWLQEDENLGNSKEKIKPKQKVSHRWWWGVGALGAGIVILNLKGKTIRFSFPF